MFSAFNSLLRGSDDYFYLFPFYRIFASKVCKYESIFNHTIFETLFIEEFTSSTNIC